MRYLNITQRLILGTAILGTSALAGVTVICHPGTAIANADVKDIFTGNKTKDSAGKPLKLVDSSASLGEFVGTIGSDAAKYSDTWVKKNFRDGVAKPEPKSSDDEAIKFVQSTDGGVGYVKSDPPGDLKCFK